MAGAVLFGQGAARVVEPELRSRSCFSLCLCGAKCTCTSRLRVCRTLKESSSSRCCSALASSSCQCRRRLHACASQAGGFCGVSSQSPARFQQCGCPWKRTGRSLERPSHGNWVFGHRRLQTFKVRMKWFQDLVFIKSGPLPIP